MKRSKRDEKAALAAGLDGAKIRAIAAHHDQQTDEEQAAEIEAALSAKDQTVMVDPTALLPEIQALLVRKRGV